MRRRLLELLDQIIDQLSGTLTVALRADGWTDKTREGMRNYFARQRELVAAGRQNTLWDAFRGLDYAGIHKGLIVDLTEEISRIVSRRAST